MNRDYEDIYAYLYDNDHLEEVELINKLADHGMWHAVVGFIKGSGLDIKQIRAEYAAGECDYERYRTIMIDLAPLKVLVDFLSDYPDEEGWFDRSHRAMIRDTFEKYHTREDLLAIGAHLLPASVPPRQLAQPPANPNTRQHRVVVATTTKEN